jgi:hypothetical protein
MELHNERTNEQAPGLPFFFYLSCLSKELLRLQRIHLFRYFYCRGTVDLGSNELTSSSFIFTGSGGICFMISGASFILQTFCMGVRTYTA